MRDRGANSFHTTHWTQVIAARGNSPEAKQALRELSETYYGPVELFIRRYRDDSQDARDLTHEFFAKLLAGNSLGNVDRTRGRFRTYLLGAVKHFLADQRDRARRLKREGGQTLQSLDQPGPEESAAGGTGPPAVIDPQGFPPDSFFDRQWALAVVEQATSSLRAEAEDNNEHPRFEVLQRWLVTPADRSAAATAARSLELTDGAFKVAVHRLRTRFRQIVVDRIAATVSDPAEVQDALNYLIGALTTPGAGSDR
jgi:RNA polymerase sigma factor (sigma-70 family)